MLSYTKLRFLEHGNGTNAKLVGTHFRAFAFLDHTRLKWGNLATLAIVGVGSLQKKIQFIKKGFKFNQVSAPSQQIVNVGFPQLFLNLSLCCLVHWIMLNLEGSHELPTSLNPLKLMRNHQIDCKRRSVEMEIQQIILYHQH